MDLDLLRSFVAVAEQGNFRSAGARSGVSQAAITQQMQRLEAQAGAPLLRRDGRGKQLTDGGRQLLRYAREILSLHDEALRALSGASPAGSLRLGSPQDVADTLLPPLLAHIARAAPRLRLDVVIGRSVGLMESLRRGEIDMTISTRQSLEFDGVVLRTSPSFWVCASDFKLAPREPLPLILIDEPSIFRRMALEALDQWQLPWRQAYGASSLIGARAAVRAGLGITARGMEMVDSGMRVLGREDGLPPLPDITYYLWVRRQAANPMVRETFELVRRQLAKR